jgi:hypothetical protein
MKHIVLSGIVVVLFIVFFAALAIKMIRQNKNEKKDKPQDEI